MYFVVDKGEYPLLDPVKKLKIISLSFDLLYREILAVFLGLDEPHEFSISTHHIHDIRKMPIEPWALLGVPQMCRDLILCLFGFFLHQDMIFLC